MSRLDQGTDSAEVRNLDVARDVAPKRKLRPPNSIVAEAARTAAPLYKRMRWTWGLRRAVPDAADLALELRRMVDTAIREDCSSSRTGRLRVDRDDDEIIVSVEVATWTVPKPPEPPATREQAHRHAEAERAALRRTG